MSLPTITYSNLCARKQGNFARCLTRVLALAAVFCVGRALDVSAAPAMDLDEVKVVGEQHTPLLGERNDLVPVNCNDESKPKDACQPSSATPGNSSPLQN